MGFDKGCLILDNENGVCFAGQTISGRLEFDQRKDKNIHGIYISIKGFCKVQWTSRRSRTVNKRRVVHTVSHYSYEEYIHQKNYVFGSESGEHALNPGRHEYAFRFHLPANCPSTFEGSYGHIRYRVKALMDTSGFLSTNKEKTVPLTVVAPTDLNTIPYCKDPIEYEILQSYCCWCINAGSSELTVRLPVGGYCPGQIIPMEVSCRNNSSAVITAIVFSIQKVTEWVQCNQSKSSICFEYSVDVHGLQHPQYHLYDQVVTFHAAYEPGTQTVEDTVAEMTKGPVPAHSTKNWTAEMTVPQMDIHNVDGCQYIDISYNFRVTTEADGCHAGERDTRQIFFGTVPLVGYNMQGIPGDQVPQQIQGVTNTYPPAPIINQPLPTSTYPNANTPYPHPYPNHPSPVPPYPSGTQGEIKTETMGFILGNKDGANVPLLPPGANIPYPQTPANPYINASAPEPSTTDIIDKESADPLAPKTK